MKTFVDLIEEISEEEEDEFDIFEFTEEEWNKLSEEERAEFEEAANGGAVWHVGDEEDEDAEADMYEGLSLNAGKGSISKGNAIDINFIGYPKDAKASAKKYKINIRITSSQSADVWGPKGNIIDYLRSPEYDMDPAEIKDLFGKDLLESIELEEWDGELGEKTFEEILDEIKRYVARNTNKRRLTQRSKDLNKFKDRAVKRKAKIDRKKAGNRVKRLKLRKKWIRRNKVKIRNANKVYGGKIKSKFTK